MPVEFYNHDPLDHLPWKTSMNKATETFREIYDASGKFVCICACEVHANRLCNLINKGEQGDNKVRYD